MAYLAPGNRSQTAWAMTWAVEWRSTARPSSESAVTIATWAPSGRGRSRSAGAPSMRAATAALARRGPMEAARSAGVAPPGRRRVDPSGRRTSISPAEPDAAGEAGAGSWAMSVTISAPAARPAWDCWAIGDRFEYRDVRVDGDGGPIVDGFSVRIPADGLTAIVGPSGSGKTTLLRLLNRLDDPDAGEVLLDGRDVRSYDVLELRQRVQVVGQVPVTFPGSVAENLGAADEEEVAELLVRVGLPPAIAVRPADVLSVGEAQRMCLARALARHPDCLVLDEPTSALDTSSKGGVERLVRSLADDGLTVVMVTHEARQAEELADRVIPMASPRSVP